MGNPNKPRFGYTGNQIEEELLGEVKPFLKSGKHLSFEVWRDNREKFRLSKAEMTRLAKNCQPEGSHPTKPSTAFARDTHAQIVDTLQSLEGFNQLDRESIMSRVKFYTAVGSPMDYALGTDGFFEIFLNDKNYVTITLDASAKEKIEYKADILIKYPQDGLDPELDKRDWEDFIAEEVRAILEAFKYKIENNEINRKK